MNRFRKLAVAAAALSSLAPTLASAATFVFTGTRQNVNPLNPPGTGRCAPLNTVNIAPGALSSTGTSNLGSFTSTQSHCIAAAPSAIAPNQPLTSGIFLYDFGGGDTLNGTYVGLAQFANGIINSTENLTVLAATGRFVGATGFIDSVGILAFQPSPSGQGLVGTFNGDVGGRLNVPAVPEPATWALMIGGFGLTGGAMRRRRRISQPGVTVA